MEGVVKKYFEDKGYGFIKSNLNSDIDFFFHISNVLDNEISVGNRVKFEESLNEKGRCATNIQTLNRKQFIKLGNVRIKLSNIKEYGVYERDYDTEKDFDRYSKEHEEIKDEKLISGIGRILGELVVDSVRVLGTIGQSRKITYLSIETYQGECWTCYAKEDDYPDGFDIDAMMEELDSYFT